MASALLTNLNAYYKLDESSGNAADSSGNGLTLTNTNVVTYAAAKINNGASLARASSQYFTAVDNALFNPSTAMSYFVWIKTATLDATPYQLGCKGDWDNTVGKSGWAIYVISTGTAIFISGSGQGFQDASTPNASQTSNPISNAVFAHVGFVYDGTLAGNSSRLKLFINGAQLTIDTFNGTIPASIFDDSASFYIGRNGSSGTQYGDGIIDEVGLWSRALTAAEVSQLYNSGQGLPYPFNLPTAGLIFQSI